MQQAEIKENIFYRPLQKGKQDYWISAVFGLISLFLLFLPFVYTYSNQYGPSFVSGFQMFSYMQDRESANLFYGTVFALIGYILGAIDFILGLIGLFTKKGTLKRGSYLNFILPGLKFGCELYSIIAFGLCAKMNIHPEFGFYLTVIASGAVFVSQIVLLIIHHHKAKTKAS